MERVAWKDLELTKCEHCEKPVAVKYDTYYEHPESIYLYFTRNPTIKLAVLTPHECSNPPNTIHG